MPRGELWSLDVESLKRLYDHQTEQLQQQLLSGVSWEETREQRQKIASISSVLYKKMNPKHFGNPAENLSRNHPGVS